MTVRHFFAAAALLSLAACSTPSASPPAPKPSPPPGPTASAPRTPTPAPAPPAPPPAPGTVFRAAEFAWSTTPGTGSIDGRLTYKNKNVAYSCAAAGVALSPETPWVKRRMEILYLSSDKATLPSADVRGRTPTERNAEYDAFVKRATCDASGRFSFKGLADGNWFVITTARPAGATAASPADMSIMRHVVIKDGKPVKLEL